MAEEDLEERMAIEQIGEGDEARARCSHKGRADDGLATRVTSMRNSWNRGGENFLS